jgi:hypothetical protein
VIENFKSWRSNSNLDFNGWSYEPDSANAVKPYYPSWYLGRGLYMYNRTATQSYVAASIARFFTCSLGERHIFRYGLHRHGPHAARSCATRHLPPQPRAYEPGALREQCYSYGDYRTHTSARGRTATLT